MKGIFDKNDFPQSGEWHGDLPPFIKNVQNDPRSYQEAKEALFKNGTYVLDWAEKWQFAPHLSPHDIGCLRELTLMVRYVPLY